MSNESQVAFLARTTPDGATIALLLQGQPTTRVTQTARAELMALIAAREAREEREAA